MPEHAVLNGFERECKYKANAVGETSGLPPEDPREHGKWVFLTACHARLEGGRSTVTIHPAPPNFPILLPITNSSDSDSDGDTDWETSDTDSPIDVDLATKTTEVCSQCNLEPGYNKKGARSPPSFIHGTPVAEVVNRLKAKGRLYCVVRGKELIVLFSYFVIRVHFALEGHCFWILTTQYKQIIKQPLEKRGKTSKAFRLPIEYVQGPSSTSLVSIQAAFIRPDWTLLFCDHNVQITFHVMRTRRVYTGEHLQPGSELWLYLWSQSHGLVPHLEPVAHGHVLDKFRNKFKANKRPIYSVLKSEAQYFNGLGAQESCDLLVQNVIHPLLPTSCLCADDLLWARFKKAIHDHFTFTYDLIHKTNNPPFPHVSSSAAFKMNIHAHSRYITAAVFCYRRASVLVDQEWLDKAHAQNLFDNQGILKRDGSASGTFSFPVFILVFTIWHLQSRNPVNHAEYRSSSRSLEELIFQTTASIATARGAMLRSHVDQTS
ncbi:fatty acid synthase alpha subunit Lsd1 [Marasmius sp. AFHP31]|nr:fatty acid synthase alpha subunit Lsd1 [Marasmius sp. AFHP31]